MTCIRSATEKTAPAVFFLSASDPAHPPASAAHVKIGQHEGYEVVEVVGRPADGDIGPQSEGEPHRVADIEDDGRQHDRECHARVARTGHTELVDESRHADDETRQHHPHGRHAAGHLRRIVGVEPERFRGKEREQHGQRHDEAEAEPRHPAAERHHGIRLTRSDQVAHQRAGRRGERIDEEEDHRRNAAHHVRYGQFGGSEMFDADEENKPTEEGHPLLQHDPDRHPQNLTELHGFETSETKKAVTPPVDSKIGVDREEKHRNPFRHRRGDGRTGDPHFGESSFAVDQQIIEQNIGQHHHHRIGRQNARAGRPDVESTEHQGREREEKAVNPVFEIVARRTAHGFRADHPRENIPGEALRQRKKHRRQQQQKERTLHEDRADLAVSSLAVAACDQHLGPDAEAETQHENHHIKHAGERRSPELGLSVPVMSQIDRIGQTDHLLHQQTDQHGKRDFQNLLIRITGHAELPRKKLNLFRPFPASAEPERVRLCARLNEMVQRYIISPKRRKPSDENPPPSLRSLCLPAASDAKPEALFRSAQEAVRQSSV